MIALVLSLWVSLAESKAAPGEPAGIRRLNPALSVDLDRRRVVIEAEVVFRSGPLELVLCPRKTKEHESILAADVPPKLVQLALLMIGARPGRPAEFQPYKPPLGEPLSISVEYDEAGEKRVVDLREWVRDGRTKKPLGADFVFAGSRFHKPPGVEKAIWLGDDGDVICVANFPGSVIDIAIPSSTDNSQLVFEAFTEKIPPLGTKVRVTIEPKKAKP